MIQEMDPVGTYLPLDTCDKASLPIGVPAFKFI